MYARSHHWVLVAVVCGWPLVAAAQRSKYPPEPVDRDREAASRSTLWEAASNPQRSPYDALIAEATQLLEDRSGIGAKDAIVKLDQAIKLLPGDAKAYRLRGDAHVMLKGWAGCAADYQATIDRLKASDVEVRSSNELRRKLGLCLARSGKLADAERVLAEAAASGIANGAGETWMRLGEVRVALGKLEEAVGALEAARDTNEVPPALIRMLLAGAYDRARRPADAVAAVGEAVQKDYDLGSIRGNALPLLGDGESEYLLGLASSLRDPPRPEHALIYFRRFLAIAVTSPWRRRVEEHINTLRTSELPEVVDRINATTASLFDPVAARPIVRRAMGPMRGCLAKIPTVLLKVEITKLGPRSTALGRRPYAPPEGVTILVEENPDKIDKPAVDVAIRCLEPLAERVKAALPAIRDQDAWYRARFLVVSP